MKINHLNSKNTSTETIVTWTHREKTSAYVSSTIIVIFLFVIAPLEALIRNWTEFQLDFLDLLRVTGVFSTLFLVFLFSFVFVLGPVLKSRLSALMLSLLVLLCLQYSLFAWDYGVFDGGGIDWSQHANKGWMEVLVWSMAVVASIFLSEQIVRNSLFIQSTVILLILAPLLISLIDYGSLEKRGSTDASFVSELMSFSKKENIIVIVLDMFQSDFFAESILDPIVESSLPPGFTYYRNAVSLYPSSRLSLQSILTSRSLNDPNQDLTPWLMEQMKGSIPNQLVSKGYRSNLLTLAPGHIGCNFDTYEFSCLSHQKFIDLIGIVEGKQRGNILGKHSSDIGVLVSLSLFRFTPHFLKPWLYNGGNWRIPTIVSGGGLLAQEDQRLFHLQQNDFVIFKALMKMVDNKSTVPTFKFLHFFSPHRPHGVDKTCNFNGAEHDSKSVRSLPMVQRREMAVDQSICILSKLNKFLEYLDAIEVYDSSMIFIVGDHGNSAATVDLSLAVPPIDVEMRNFARVPINPETNRPIIRTSRSVPLFLLKPRNARHSLKISDTPVSLCDVPKTIFDALNFENDFDCESVIELEKRRSKRVHYEYSGSDKGPTYSFRKFYLDGHSWYPGSFVLEEPLQKAN